jgi:hypothetical protein
LRLTGEDGRWEFSRLGSKEALLGVDAEMKDLRAKVAEEAQIRERLAKINALLGVKVNATKK